MSETSYETWKRVEGDGAIIALPKDDGSGVLEVSRQAMELLLVEAGFIRMDRKAVTRPVLATLATSADRVTMSAEDYAPSLMAGAFVMPGSTWT